MSLSHYRDDLSKKLAKIPLKNEKRPLPVDVCRSKTSLLKFIRPRPQVSGDFCIRKFFYADTPSVHTCPPYTLGVSGDFCICSPDWKFLYTLFIRIRVDPRIRIFLYTLTSQYQNQSFSARDLTNPLRCPDTNRIRVDGRIRFVYATCGGRYFCIRIKKFADTKISGYVWTGPKLLMLINIGQYLHYLYQNEVLLWQSQGHISFPRFL